MSATVLRKFLAEMPDLPEFINLTTVGIHTHGLWKSTPLHVAAVRGDVAVIAALLDAGADIQSRGEDGASPLHDAAGHGHLEAVKFLLGRGASVKATDDDGYTPIWWAQVSKSDEIIRVLQDHVI